MTIYIGVRRIPPWSVPPGQFPPGELGLVLGLGINRGGLTRGRISSGELAGGDSSGGNSPRIIYTVLTLQPKFRGCPQMTFSSFVRIFARLLLTSFENVLSRMLFIHSMNNYFEAFQQLFLKYIPCTVHMKLVYKYRACMLSKPGNRLFTSSNFAHVKSKFGKRCILSSIANISLLPVSRSICIYFFLLFLSIVISLLISLSFTYILFKL